MKTRRVATAAMFACVLLMTTHEAQAFYNPSAGRWLNRDPINEPGHKLFRSEKRLLGPREELALYGFVSNNPIERIDPDGLKIWVCTRPTKAFGGIGKHSYFWDDRKETDEKKRSCGKHGSSGSDTGTKNETGPGSGETKIPWTGKGEYGPAECYPANDSDGKEDGVMNCCNKNATKGTFVPYANDCHDFVDDCLRKNDLDSPPHSRGDPISNHAKDIQCACEGYGP